MLQCRNPKKIGTKQGLRYYIVYQYNSKFLSMTYTTMEIKHEVNQ